MRYYLTLLHVLCLLPVKLFWDWRFRRTMRRRERRWREHFHYHNLALRDLSDRYGEDRDAVMRAWLSALELFNL